MADKTADLQAQLDAIDAELARRGETAAGAQPAPASAPAAAPQADESAEGVTQPGSVMENVGKVAADIVKGVAVEGVGGIVRGFGGAMKETGDLVTEGAQAIASTGTVGGALVQGLNTAAPGVVSVAAPAMSWLGAQVKDLYAERESVTGNLIEGVSQFVTGMIGAGKFVALPKAIVSRTGGKVVEGMVKGAIVDATVFDGNDARLSNLIEQFPALNNPVTEFLAANPDDSEAVGRLKNAMEGLVVGPLADAFIAVLKLRKAVNLGNAKGTVDETNAAEHLMKQLREQPSPEEAALKALDPENGVKVDGTPATAKAADEGVPQGEKIDGPKVDETNVPKLGEEPGPKGEHDAPAPYGTDTHATNPTAPPTGFKLKDLYPKLPKGTDEEAVEAIQRRFTMNPDDGGLMPRSDRQPFNMSRIDSPETLQAALDAVTDVGAKAIQRARGGDRNGVRTLASVKEQAAAWADEIGGHPGDFMTVLGHDAASIFHLDARMKAYRDFRDDAVAQAAEFADKALTMKGSPDGVKLQAQALHYANLAIQVSAKVKGIETNVARALGSQRLTSTSARTVAKWDMDALAKQLETGTYHADDDALLNALKSFKDNPKGFSKFMEATITGKISGAFNQYFMNALLSSPKTHVANFMSNTAMTLYRPLERAVEGMMPANYIGAGRSIHRMVDEYHGLILGLHDALKVAGQALKNNTSIMDPKSGSHVDPTGRQVEGLSARGLGLTHDYYTPGGELIRTETTPILSELMDGISNFVGIPGRLLTAGDELFKQANYRAYAYSQATDSARVLGLKDKDFADHVSTRMNQLFDASGEATNMEARQVSREATFTQDLEYGVSRWVQGASNEHVALKLVVPFVRTPVNLFRFSWRHSPFAPLEQGFKADWSAGGQRRAKAQAQLTTAAAFWGIASYYAYTGAVVGGLSANPEIRKAEEATGKKEYSFKIGNKYVQFNRMEPFATVLGLAADLVQVSDRLTDFEFDKIAGGMTMALAKNLASKTYLQGLTNAFNGLGDYMAGRSAVGLDSFAYRTLASVAVPSIINAHKNDEYLREARNSVDAVKARLPGSSKEVPPVRNVLGEVVEAPKALGPNAWSPIGMSVAKNDPVYDELARQMKVTNHPLNRITPQVEGTNIDLREVTLKSGQNAYDRMQQLLWESGVKEALHDLFTDESWKDLKDGSVDYANAPGTKLHITNKVLLKYKDQAKQQLIAENEELGDLVRAEADRRNLTGIDGDSPRHYQPPGLLDSLLGRKKNDLRRAK